MQISELRKALSSFEAVLGHMQANKSAIADLTRFNECLAQFDGLTVTQFCKACEQLVPRSTPAVPRQAASFDETMVAAYVARLRDITGDSARFEVLFAELKADKAVRITELSEIAQRFVGGTSKYAK